MRIFSHRILAPPSPLFARATDADAAVCLPPLPPLFLLQQQGAAAAANFASRVATTHTPRDCLPAGGEAQKKREGEAEGARARLRISRAPVSLFPYSVSEKNRSFLEGRGGGDAAKHEGEEEEEWHAITAVAASFVGFYLSRFLFGD